MSDDFVHYTMSDAGIKEGNILFNNALNTFFNGYIAWDIVRVHSDNKTGNLLLPHGLFFLTSSKG